MAAFKAFILKIWATITGWFTGLVTRIEAFGGMLLTRLHAFVEMLIIKIHEIHEMISSIIDLFKKPFSGIQIFCFSVLGVSVIAYIVLLGKLKIFKFLLNAIETLILLISQNLLATLLVAISTIGIILAVKELKAIKKV